MRCFETFGSKDGTTIVEVILSIVLIFITVLVVTTVAVSVKERCVKGENLQEATKLSMYVLEELLPLAYTNTGLTTGFHPSTLPACNLTNRYPGTTGSYTVTEPTWGAGTYNNYKEITATINWTYNGELKSVSVGVLKGQE